jgi:hypothetical protein
MRSTTATWRQPCSPTPARRRPAPG